MLSTTDRLAAVAVIAGSLVLFGCDAKKESKPATADSAAAPAGLDSASIAKDSPANAEVKTYIVHGTPTKIDEQKGEIVMDHEKIEGFMEAMTMPFKVSDPALLKQVTVGKPTHFTLRVAGWEMLITKIQDDHDAGHAHGDSAGKGH